MVPGSCGQAAGSEAGSGLLYARAAPGKTLVQPSKSYFNVTKILHLGPQGSVLLLILMNGLKGAL